jgi:hypothetical protein
MATFKGWGNERKNAVDWSQPIVPAMGDALMWKQREARRRAEEAARAGRDWALGEDFFARGAPQVEELPMAPPTAMPMPMAPEPMAAPPSMAMALPQAPAARPVAMADRFMIDRMPAPAWPARADEPMLPEAPQAPAAPTTGVFLGGQPWTPKAPGAMSSDEYEAYVAGRAAGRRASAGLDRDVRANAALSERIGKMGEALGQPIPKKEWDDYNQRTRENAMRMGIGAPDPENDRDMAVWAQGQTNVAGQMRRSPQERAEARGNADRYRQEQEAARNREAQVRIAEAEREGEWTTDPTGRVLYNKRTKEMTPTGVAENNKPIVVGKTVVQIQDDGTAKVLYDGSNSDERILGYTVDEFIEMDKNSWNFDGETRDRWSAFRDEWMAEAEKRGQKKETPAAAGGGGGGGLRVFK